MPAVGIRLIEGCHQQVQVRRQRLHDGDFFDMGSHNGGHHLSGTGIDIEPGWQRRVVEEFEVALDALGAPGSQVLLDAGGSAPRLEAQRVADEVDALVLGILRG